MQVRSLSIRRYWGKMKKKEVIQFPPQRALIKSAQLKKKKEKKFSRERKRAVQSRLDEFRFIRKSLCGAHIFWHITDHKLKRKKFEQRTSQTSQ